MPDRHTPAARNIRMLLTLIFLLSAFGCGGGVVAGGSTEQKTTIPEENVTVNRPVSAAPTALECGQPFERPPGGELRLTGRFPVAVSSTEKAVSGTVEVANENEVVRGVVTPNADVFLVRNGRIATLPLPQDLVGVRLELAAGKVKRLPAQATLSPCDPGASAAHGSLRPGTYELYARVVVNHDDGSSRESIGGPWPLEVR